MLMLFTFWYLFRKANIGCFFLCVMPLSEALVKNARIMLGMENVFTLAKSRDVKWMLGGYSKPNYLCNVNWTFKWEQYEKDTIYDNDSVRVDKSDFL